MRWRSSEVAAQKFDALAADPNALSRGRDLELFLAELFGREHYRVDRNFVAAGRQVDLFVIRGDLRLLVEAKWTKRRAQHDVIDGIRARLDTAPDGVVGVVVSMSGFSSKVVERVERAAGRSIVLIDGDEVRQVVRDGGGLHTLVQVKLDRLVRSRQMVFGSEARPRTWLDALPESSLKIVDAGGVERPWWESSGDFSETVNSLVRPDADWARAGAVRLNFTLGVRDASGLVGLLKLLSQLGWISGEGAWRIEQQGVAWSGLGPAEFARQLTSWEGRYRDRRLHHSEQALYVDESDDGMLILTADLSATSGRLVRWCELAFMLPGIPLDATPYEGLVAELPVLNTPSFRVLDEDPVQTARLGSRGKPRRVKPLAYLVRDEPALGAADQANTRWVEGIVVGDPLPSAGHATRIAASLPGVRLGDLFVQLRQHHDLGDDAVHELHWASFVQGSPTSVLHVMGDWDWRHRPSVTRRPRSVPRDAG